MPHHRFFPEGIAYTDVGKVREQDAVSFAYTDVGKGREQDAVSFASPYMAMSLTQEILSVN